MTTATDLDKAMEAFLAKGGAIQELDYAGNLKSPEPRSRRRRNQQHHTWQRDQATDLTMHTHRRAEKHLGTIRELLDQGASLAQILKVVKGGLGQLRAIMKAYGLKPADKGHTPGYLVAEHLVEGLSQGLTVVQVCELHGHNKKRAYKIYRMYSENNETTRKLCRGWGRNTLTAEENVALMVLLYQETTLRTFRECCADLHVGEDRAARLIREDSVLRNQRSKK